MAYNQDEVTKKLKINLRGVDPDDRRSVLEEIGEFVNALDIYHILAADTEEQIGI